ncbi:hypothetical protein ACWC5O_09470 [Streptomyces sp. NPDC001450]
MRVLLTTARRVADRLLPRTTAAAAPAPDCWVTVKRPDDMVGYWKCCYTGAKCEIDCRRLLERRPAGARDRH